MVSFFASVVTTEAIEGVPTVAFTDDGSNPSNYLILQRDNEGTPRLYVEWNDQSRSCYGGVESVRLTECLVTLHLDPVGERALRAAEPLAIEFALTPASLDSLRAALSSICSGIVRVDV